MYCSRYPGYSRKLCSLSRELTKERGQFELAQLVPESVSLDIRTTLRLSDGDNGIRSLRNVLLLSWKDEDVFTENY